MREKKSKRYNKHKRTPKFMLVGVGGMKCPCCFAAPGSLERRLIFRQAKRREARAHWKAEALI